MNSFSDILDAAARGDRKSSEALLPLVYEELRRIARGYLADQSSAHTLQPTALVHEAWIKMVENQDQTWQNRACFLSTAATAMRHILIDHARKKTARKRGGNPKRVDIQQLNLSAPEPNEIMLMVEEALQELEQVRPEWARIAVLKYYGGLTNKEVSEALETSERTVERYWAGARAWLYKQMISDS